MISADDMSYFLQVARHQRLTLAGHALGVNHTTVGRRIVKLESDLGVRLFSRRSSGWALTEAGDRLLVHAETIEDALNAATNVSEQEHASLSGSVRIVTPDGFGAFLLAPGLGPLRSKHPDLTLEIMTSSQKSSFTTREFDIAVVLLEPSPRSVWSRPLLGYTLGLYASRDYLARYPEIKTIEDLHAHTLIFYVDETLDIDPLRIMSEILPGYTAMIQINNITGHWKATAAGLGIAPLPSYIGDVDENLVRVLPGEVEVRRTYWIVVPRGLLRLPRVRAAAELIQAIALEHSTDD
ncbi:LysR family transcriptional regulator [Arthrobacter sp. Soil736]|uniref:LysR family transcriptional regulator n=1 Tax=Arthrobacter sp. Soil736 TaxID=1736395 RepID=UPI0006F9E6DC|nr:LysR family transcriptional regulator [Arthrobacter sp. Soil736]KRE45989.1 LysR family transcriptional regulator [Arthrobacter sp. Soil736]